MVFLGAPHRIGRESRCRFVIRVTTPESYWEAQHQDRTPATPMLIRSSERQGGIGTCRAGDPCLTHRKYSRHTTSNVVRWRSTFGIHERISVSKRAMSVSKVRLHLSAMNFTSARSFGLFLSSFDNARSYGSGTAMWSRSYANGITANRSSYPSGRFTTPARWMKTLKRLASFEAGPAISSIVV